MYPLFLFIALILSIGANIFVKTTYKKFNAVKTARGMTADRFAQMMLTNHDINDVTILVSGRELSDAYSNKSKSLYISAPNFGNSSVSAIGIAAHEAGHAIQYKEGYWPVVFKSTMVPAVNIGSWLGVILVFIGLGLDGALGDKLWILGILFYSLTFLYTLVTLPVEFNASRRAIAEVSNSGVYSQEEIDGMRKVLTAAALTYVAAMLSALVNLLRILGTKKQKKK